MHNINVGDIFYAYTEATNPPKEKIHVCVAEDTFMYINTNNRRWEENFLIKTEEISLLNHDSFICFSELIYCNSNTLEPRNKQPLPKAILERLCNEVNNSDILTQNQINEIIVNLTNIISTSLSNENTNN